MAAAVVEGGRVLVADRLATLVDRFRHRAVLGVLAASDMRSES